MEEAGTVRFLLVFDHVARRLVASPREFRGDVLAALDAYDEAEEEYAALRDRYEVLLVGAASLAEVKVTHSRFFPEG